MNNTKEVNYVGPFLAMVALFFIVGFLTVVNQQFQLPLKSAFLSEAGDIKNTLATLITFSWFLAYPLTGGIGANWVDKFGYKKTLIRALIILIIGLGIFVLSAWQHANFPAYFTVSGATVPYGFIIFLIGSYVVGAAATILQVVINPYLVACTVKGTSGVQRQMIGGSSNSIGTTIAPFFVAAVVFGGRAADAIQVGDLIIPFVGLMIAIAVVTFAVSKFTLPNIAGTTNESGEKLEKSIWSFSHLTLGVIAIFFYVGVEVCVGANISMYADSIGGEYLDKVNFLGQPLTIAAMMSSLYWLGMLIGRLISSTFNNISARTQLTATSVAAIILLVTSMIANNPWFLVGVGLFHSVMWSAIFVLAIDKLGKYTSKGSGALMIGVLGGGVLPLVQGMLADAMGGNWEMTWILVIASELYLLYYALAGSKVKQVG